MLGIKREETFYQDASLGILPSGPGGKDEDHNNSDGSRAGNRAGKYFLSVFLRTSGLPDVQDKAREGVRNSDVASNSDNCSNSILLSP